MPKNKQYLSVKLLKTMGVKITNTQLEKIAAAYLDHNYNIYDIRDLIKKYKRVIK